MIEIEDAAAAGVKPRSFKCDTPCARSVSYTHLDVYKRQLKKAALGYTRAVAFHNGDLAPFAESCIRLENGTLSALGPNDNPPIPIVKSPPANGAPSPPSFFVLGLGCAKQLDRKSYTFITGYEDAHFPIVDTRRQIVFATFDFLRRGNVESWTLDGRSVPYPEGMRYPNEILNTEIFKFVDGKITRVEAVFEGPQSYMRGKMCIRDSPSAARSAGPRS